MKTQIFQTKQDLELIIKSRKSAIIFEIKKGENDKELDFSFHFTPEGFQELLAYLEVISMKSWTNLTPKEADSMGTDYSEYYDRELDNNGYLRIRQNVLSIERPSLESERIYQFNKQKMESFLYDFRKIAATGSI